MKDKPCFPAWRLFRLACACAFWCCALTDGYAQLLPGPRVGYIYPAGGRPGTTFDVKLGGQFLDGITNAYFSGNGIEAVVLSHTKPLTAGQANALREKLKALQDKRVAAQRGRRSGGGTNAVFTAADMRELESIRTRLAGFQRRPPNPAIAEVVRMRVTVASDATPGLREIRLRAAQGLSNPLTFSLGTFPEVCERTTDQPQPVMRGPRSTEETRAVPTTEMSIALPATINGQILQGGVDRYRFQARKGQKLVAAVSARELIPYIPDAVPGWFQATLTLRDAKGAELAFSDDYQFRPDPVLFFEVPKDAEYVLEIKDAIFRGRDDFVYRITVGEAPFLTGVFPLGGQVGTAAELSLNGWNLPSSRVVQPSLTNAGLCELSIVAGKPALNHLSVAFDILPERVEKESNDSTAAAELLSLPIIVNGKTGAKGDLDWFRFEAKAGQEIVAEVIARRLESPLDSRLTLRDASGQQLALNDDYEDKAAGLDTHHADSYIKCVLPKAGTYYLLLEDAQRRGGDLFGYRLRLSEPRPDFELRVVPSSINFRGGAHAPITVYALRKDGFTNEVSLALDDAPPGFSLSGARIPAGADHVRLTISGPPQPDPVDISLSGQAWCNGKRLSRPAVPAEDMMQAFAYRHLVPAQQLKVVSNGRVAGRGGMRIVSSLPVKIFPGGSASVKLNAPVDMLRDRFDLELSEPPEGLAIDRIVGSGFGSEIFFKADAATCKPGLKGNLIVNVVAGKAAGNKTKKQPVRRAAVSVLPAIPFETVTQN